ncbi:Uncharacterised protein [Mycobacteroides abscessus subsp. abscessus]|nr:Uncharacterised protein [Mycobacteroides abscessus subsp. abscessus]
MPASSTTMRVSRPTSSNHLGVGLSGFCTQNTYLARVSATEWMSSLRTLAADAVGAKPSTVPPLSVQARPSTFMLAVLPVPAGARHSRTRACEEPSWRTMAAWPALSAKSLLAACSSKAISMVR